MPKSRLALVATAVALLSIFAAPAANAAYTEPPVETSIETSPQPGGTFDIDLDTSPVVCEWSSVFTPDDDATGAGEQTGPSTTGTSYHATFTAPDTGAGVVTVTCLWDPALYAAAPLDSADSTVVPAFFSAKTKSATLASALETKTYSFAIDTGVAGAGDSGDGDGSGDSDDEGEGALPDTGGSNATLLALGAGLVVAGAGVTVAARRRKTA